jgi:hypothetical protein
LMRGSSFFGSATFSNISTLLSPKRHNQSFAG